MMPDHVHMGIAIPPKHPIASVIGFLKGKSAIAVARELWGRERNFTGEHLWARGYAVSTVGFELEQVRQYTRGPEEADGSNGGSELSQNLKPIIALEMMPSRLNFSTFEYFASSVQRYLPSTPRKNPGVILYWIPAPK